MHGSWAHFIIVALMLQCTMPLAAFAAVVNGSFEAGFGSFTGWARIGDTSIQTSGIGIAPTDGRFMALLTTLCDFKTDARGESQQGLEGGHRDTPPVEAEGELIQVSLEVIVADTMVGPTEPSLEISKDPMNARQDLPGALGWALRPRPMAIAHARQRRVGTPTIRQDDRPGLDALLHESRQRAHRGVGHDLEPNSAGGSATHFDRAHNQGLLQELAAPLQTGLGTTQVGFVDFDLVLQCFPLRIHHGPAQLVQERPGCLVADLELALQLHRRQSGCMSGHEVGGPEPHRQRQPRPMQDRARRQRGLPSARLALPEPPLRQLEDFSLPALPTAKAVRPSASGQVLPTRIVIPESD